MEPTVNNQDKKQQLTWTIVYANPVNRVPCNLRQGGKGPQTLA